MLPCTCTSPFYIHDIVHDIEHGILNDIVYDIVHDIVHDILNYIVHDIAILQCLDMQTKIGLKLA